MRSTNAGIAASFLAVLLCSGCADPAVFVYANRVSASSVANGALMAYRLNVSSGELVATGDEYADLTEVAGSAFGRFVYAFRGARAARVIAGYEVDAASGRLTLIGDYPTFSPSNNAAYRIRGAGDILIVLSGGVSTGTRGGLTSYRVDSRNGSLSMLKTVLADPQEFGFHKGSDWVFAHSDLGGISRLWAVNGLRSGSLVAQAAVRVYPGGEGRGVSALMVHPILNVIYVTFLTPAAAAAPLEVLEFDEQMGSIKVLSIVPEPATQRMAIDPQGRYLFTSAQDGVRVYSIQQDGRLRLLETLALPSELTHELTVDPTGNFLFISAPAVDTGLTEQREYRIVTTDGPLRPTGVVLKASGTPLFLQIR